MMKKITLLLLFLTSFLSFGQTCNQTFAVTGQDDAPTVLTINSTDVNCYGGTLNTLTISAATLGSQNFCNTWYSFEMDLDGAVSDVCAADLVGMDLSSFTTLTITSRDLPTDDWSDTVTMSITITADFTVTTLPNCDAVMTSPADGATDILINQDLAWSSASGGVAGYNLTVGTLFPGNDDVVSNMTNVGNVTSYTLPNLMFATTYYVSIVPYNANGNALGCTDYSFTTAAAPAEGNLCENAISINALPYTTSDDTANYSDIYYEGSPGASGCGSTSGYLGGNDVVYTYNSTIDGTIKINIETTATYVGVFAYSNCNDIGVSCIGGAVNGFAGGAININEFPVVSGQTYYFVISTWPAPQTAAYTLNITENTCTNATATYTVVSNCLIAPEFFVDVDITNLGSAFTLTLSDDQGSANQFAFTTGTIQFGPYANGTSVVITTTNDQDATCVITSAAQTQNACPPANDACANPIVLTSSSDFATGLTNVTTAGATLSAELPIQSCGNFNFATTGKDVWYSVTVPASGSITIETKGNGGTITDSVLQVYSGTCGALVAVDCDDDDGDGNFSLISLTGRPAGEVLLVRAFGYNGSEGTFDIAAYDASLSNDTFDNANFRAYPNPVKSTLNLSYNKEISSVNIYNLMGQQVATKVVNSNNSQIDMSTLPTGTYMVKVVSDNQVKTLKVIKE